MPSMRISKYDFSERKIIKEYIGYNKYYKFNKIKDFKSYII